MCERGNDQAIDVGQDRGHRFALLRGRGRQRCFQIAGFDLSQDREFANLFKVTRDPVDEFVAVPAKLCGGHVADRRSWFLL